MARIDPIRAVLIPAWSTEGPIYADRCKGRLTFHDWDRWTKEDQAKYAELKRSREANGAH